MGVTGVSDVEAADVQMGEASDDGDEAEDETDGEADEIEGVHVIWCSVWRLFLEQVGWWPDAMGLRGVRLGRGGRGVRVSR